MPSAKRASDRSQRFRGGPHRSPASFGKMRSPDAVEQIDVRRRGIQRDGVTDAKSRVGTGPDFDEFGAVTAAIGHIDELVRAERLDRIDAALAHEAADRSRLTDSPSGRTPRVSVP